MVKIISLLLILGFVTYSTTTTTKSISTKPTTKKPITTKLTTTKLNTTKLTTTKLTTTKPTTTKHTTTKPTTTKPTFPATDSANTGPPTFTTTSPFTTTSQQLPEGTVLLKRGFDPDQGHWATTGDLPAGFNLESSVLILSSKMTGSALRYSCTAEIRLNNFISMDPKCEGQTVLGPLGYFYLYPVGQFTTKLYRCYNFNTADHYHSIDKNCEKIGGTNEGLIGYVSINF